MCFKNQDRRAANRGQARSHRFCVVRAIAGKHKSCGSGLARDEGDSVSQVAAPSYSNAAAGPKNS